jgi:hypothetical protein
MTTRTLPNSLKLIRNYLASVSSVQSFVTSRVYDIIPANPQFPAVMLRRAAGSPEWYGDDRAIIDIHCYGRGNTPGEAASLARACFKALMEAPQVRPEGVLTSVRPSGDFYELRDPVYVGPSAPERYIFSIFIATHS